jgi:hypothetical protein
MPLKRLNYIVKQADIGATICHVTNYTMSLASTSFYTGIQRKGGGIFPCAFIPIAVNLKAEALQSHLQRNLITSLLICLQITTEIKRIG